MAEPALKTDYSTNGVEPAVAASGNGAVADAPISTRLRSSWEGVYAALHPPSGIRLQLQGRARSNLRRHFLREARRVAVLMASDVLTFWGVRTILRAVRDHAMLGESFASVVRGMAPAGPFSGWQFSVALLLGLVVTGNYGAGDLRRSPKQLFYGCALAVALPMWLRIWSNPGAAALVHYGLATVLLWTGLVVSRLTLNKLIPRSLSRERHAARTVIVGPAEEARILSRSKALKRSPEFLVMGFIDTHKVAAPDALGHVTDFARMLHDRHVETVVVCGQLDSARFVEVSEAALAAQCQLLTSPRSPMLFGIQPTVVWKHGQPFVELNTPAVRAQALVLKRIVDTVAALLGLIVLAPLFLVVALLVRLDSSGPVLFGSERWGQGGRRITIWKFRTMISDAVSVLQNDEQLREAFERDVKLVRDPRITRVGRWLRRSSMDELPQLFNVLIGQMSLVGPRPKLFGEERKYGMVFDAVLSVPPGLTGLWQVSGRNSLSYEERISLDLEYVRRCSLSLDVRLLLQTVRVVLGGVGAH